MRRYTAKRISAVISAVIIFICSFSMPAFAAYENTHTNTGKGQDDIVAVAATQIGYSESKGATKYGTAMGNSTMDWCCAFVVWCARQAGISETVIPQTASCSTMYSLINSKLISASQSQGSNYIPQKGDLAFFKDFSHIGIVETVQSNTVYIIEGNATDMVKRLTYSLTSSELIAFASPDYSNSITGLTFLLNATMNIRSSSNSSSTLLGTLSEGSTVTVKQITSSNWGMITYKGTNAWMSLDWSTFKYGTYETTEITNLHSSASSSSSVTDTIPKGTKLTVSKIGTTAKNWGYVSYGGFSGWICLMPGGDKQQSNVKWTIIDISQWNIYDLDWAKLKSSGVKGAIIRIGGRKVNSKTLYEDDYFAELYKAAKEAGMYVGVYFFSYALTEAQAKEEAELTVKILQRNNCVLDMPVFIDIEDYSFSDGKDYQHYRAGKTACTKVVNTFCEYIENAGYYPGVYCTLDFATTLIDSSAFANRALWIAQYGVSQCSYDGSFDMWQYTRYGQISGSSRSIDLSVCYTDFPSLINKNDGTYGEHIAGTWQVVKNATCTSEGQRKLTCRDCGKVLKTETISPTEHSQSVICVQLLKTSLTVGTVLTQTQINSLHKKTDADFETQMIYSCCQTQGGTVLKYCTTCKKVLSTEYYYTSCSHSNTELKSQSLPTCTGEGVNIKVCTDCGKTLTASLASRTEHKEGSATYTGASCIEGVMRNSVCSKCGKEYESVYTFRSEHEYGDWTLQKKVTVKSDGIYSAKCNYCSSTTTKTVVHQSYGDIDGDNEITAADARLALRYSVKLEELSEAALCSADMDADGSINAADARLLLRVSVGLDNGDSLLEKYYPNI